MYLYTILSADYLIIIHMFMHATPTPIYMNETKYLCIFLLLPVTAPTHQNHYKKILHYYTYIPFSINYSTHKAHFHGFYKCVCFDSFFAHGIHSFKYTFPLHKYKTVVLYRLAYNRLFLPCARSHTHHHTPILFYTLLNFYTKKKI